MKTLMVAALLLGLAACVTESPEHAFDPTRPRTVTKTDDEVRAEQRVAEDFDAWKQATIEGDFQAHYSGMTGAYISDWLYKRTQSMNDKKWPQWEAKLPERFKLDFEDWVRENRTLKPDRAGALPDEIIKSAWLRECYQDYFRADFEAAKAWLSSGRVVAVAVDRSGATVTSSLAGHTEMWAMVRGSNGHWYVDGYVRPRQ